LLYQQIRSPHVAHWHAIEALLGISNDVRVMCPRLLDEQLISIAWPSGVEFIVGSVLCLQLNHEVISFNDECSEKVDDLMTWQGPCTSQVSTTGNLERKRVRPVLVDSKRSEERPPLQPGCRLMQTDA
jgi:hypothetical protein